MRIVLADLKGRTGFVSKDTVAGGYGSRLQPFTRVTRVVHALKRHLHDLPSVQLAYLAAIAAQWKHDVVASREALVDGDVAIVLSSLVDYRQETAWADAMRARGVRVGFIGLAASRLPFLFSDHADFVIAGEPESMFTRLAKGEALKGWCESAEIADLDSLPFPRWDLVEACRPAIRYLRGFGRLLGGYPLLTSRSCPEFCTYCPHRVLSSYRARSIQNIADELQQLCQRVWRPYVVFRDPLFSQDRDRCLHLSEEIRRRGLRLTFECETRLDRLDSELLDRLYASGLRAITFGVESLSPDTLRRVGRRPIPPEHQRAIVEHCRRRGIATIAFYVLGFLQDDWRSTAATIEYAVALGSTLAQFKVLTPYPGTPLWKQLEPLLTQQDWERFDGFTPTFRHPNLTAGELQFLLGAAYTRFYVRPSFLSTYMGGGSTWLRDLVRWLDDRVSGHHTRTEIAKMLRPVTC